MRSSTRTVTVETFTSDVDPKISSQDPQAGFTIAWADAHPISYKIVASSKSKAFGIGSSAHIGWAQTGRTAEATIERLTTLRMMHEGGVILPGEDGRPVLVTDLENIFCWRAHFTLAHFEKKGFTGGLFQQHATWTDGKSYARAALDLDYTPETLEEVLDRFCVWMDATCAYPDTTHITLDGRVVRKFGGDVTKEGC